MAARAWRLLGAVCAERLAVGRPYADLGIEAVADSAPGEGPLAALADGLARVRAPRALVLPCDVPRLPAAALEALIARADANPAPGAVVVEHEGRARPLPGLYAVSVLAVARRLLADGRRALRDLLDAVPHVAVAPAAWGDPAGATLEDIDRPADVA